jgi:hypothetical protein
VKVLDGNSLSKKESSEDLSMGDDDFLTLLPGDVLCIGLSHGE